MLKQHKTALICSSAVIVLPLLAALIFWNKLPTTIPIHWNAAGQVDGYGSKTMAFLLMPAILLAVQCLCVLVTTLDRRTKEQNRKPLVLVLWIIPIINLVTQALMLSAALGYSPDVTTWFCILLGAMFVLIGNYLPKCKQNRFLGIKIKWTLQSEENWDATHRFGGKVWVIGGIGFFLCLLIPSHIRFIPVMILIALLVILPFVYSYRYHKKHP